jgi:hypothetical protein
MDLLDLLKRPEGKTLEFKRDLSSSDGALKTIVAFANTAGGTLLIGVEDRSRNVRGMADPLVRKSGSQTSSATGSALGSYRNSRFCPGGRRRCWRCRRRVCEGGLHQPPR